MEQPCSLQCVIETVGVNLLSFIDPRQMFLLSIVNHHYHEELIHQYILSTCANHIMHLDIKLGSGSNYLIEFVEGASFNRKTELWDHIFAKITSTSMQLHNKDKARIHELRSTAESQSNIKLSSSSGDVILTASCDIQSRSKQIAKGLARYLINRDACKNGSGKEYYSFIQDWLNYLIHLRGIAIHFWEWDLLYVGRRQFGKGLVFSSIDVRDVVEIRLTRFY